MKHKAWDQITKAGEIDEPGNSMKFTTGDWRVIMPKWDSEVCKQCGLCWPVCPENAITVNKESGLLTHFDYDYCMSLQNSCLGILNADIDEIHLYESVKLPSAPRGSEDEAKEAIRVWLETPFSGEERHERRIAKIEESV